MSSIAPDLRITNKPLFQRLSSASAGQSPDDAADIQLIRDEWIRNNARSLVRLGRLSLSVRIGTFNVNGKMPSQDLSSWIQGTSSSNSVKFDISSQSPSLNIVSSMIPDSTRSSSAGLCLSVTRRGSEAEPDMFFSVYIRFYNKCHCEAC